jgi:hypothetical protein
LADVGVSNIVVIGLLLRESALDNKLVQLNDREIERLKADLREALKHHPEIGLRVNDYQQVNDKYIILESDGNLVMSSDINGDKVLGSILQENGPELLQEALRQHTLEHQKIILSPI